MITRSNEPSAVTAAMVGLLALASAMGIGRFSLTPMLPLMQRDIGLSFALGGWLATSNYLGYLIGALICMASAPRPAAAIRWGLTCIAGVTLAMGLSRSPQLWFAYRFAAGVASAFVLVGVSAWAMPILARNKKERWSGAVFAGVGIGIVLAGLAGLAAGLNAWPSPSTWIAIGAIAALLAICLWPLVPDPVAAPPAAPNKGRMPRHTYVAAACYGLFGYGYIIPATFLPALARGYVDNPALFGLTWPVFGAAAALSTLAAARFGHRLAPRRLWVAAQWLLAAGVLAPAVALNLATLSIAAICVGGTFMVITMAGIREVLRIAGAARASQGVGMMTAAFATGQIAGPLTVTLLAGSRHAFAIASIVAALALVAGNVVLTIDGARRERLPIP